MIAYAVPVHVRDLAAGGGLLDKLAEYAARAVEGHGVRCAAVMITMPNAYGLRWVNRLFRRATAPTHVGAVRA